MRTFWVHALPYLACTACCLLNKQCLWMGQHACCSIRLSAVKHVGVVQQFQSMCCRCQAFDLVAALVSCVDRELMSTMVIQVSRLHAAQIVHPQTFHATVRASVLELLLESLTHNFMSVRKRGHQLPHHSCDRITRTINSISSAAGR
jgi:hypothetical protein